MLRNSCSNQFQIKSKFRYKNLIKIVMWRKKNCLLELERWQQFAYRSHNKWNPLYTVKKKSYLFSSVKELSLSVLEVFQRLSPEIIIIYSGRDFNLFYLQPGAGGNCVDLVYSSERTAVQHKWTSHKQKASAKLLQEHNSLRKKKTKTIITLITSDTRTIIWFN